jgi:hypothetical protein
MQASDDLRHGDLLSGGFVNPQLQVGIAGSVVRGKRRRLSTLK